MVVVVEKKTKIFVIGLDGATFDVIRPMISQGKLPTLKKLIERGCSSKLKTVLGKEYFKGIALKNIQSVTAWTSFTTGTEPKKHGIYHFVNQANELINSNSVKSHCASWSPG